MTTTALDASRSSAFDYLELTKPRITFMVVMTALVGFVMGSPGSVSGSGLLAALLGTGLVAAGASALNMVFERRTDARMQRTQQRPLPSGRLHVPQAAAFGLVLTLLGLAELWWLCGGLAASVAFVTWGSYLFVYTPLKSRTSLATVVGAVPGALPPVIGWTAASGALEPGAALLFAILFLWQIPHFLAIAWMYREDYARGGLPMLPVLDPEGHMTGRQALANSLALLLVSLTPTVAGLTGPVYLLGASLLGLVFVILTLRWALLRTRLAAWRVFLASVIYLPALSTLLLVNRL